MKTYELTLKHDGGNVKITTRAGCIEEAIMGVCQAEKAPHSAVQTWRVIAFTSSVLRRPTTRQIAISEHPALTAICEAAKIVIEKSYLREGKHEDFHVHPEVMGKLIDAVAKLGQVRNGGGK